MRISVTIGFFGGIKSHLVLIWPGMNRASSAAAARALVTALEGERGGRGLTMSPLLTAVLLRGGTEPCTDLHAAVQRPGRTRGALVYNCAANNVTAEEAPPSLLPAPRSGSSAPLLRVPAQHLSPPSPAHSPPPLPPLCAHSSVKSETTACQLSIDCAACAEMINWSIWHTSAR